LNIKHNILLTVPSLQGKGGVAAYYKGVLPHLQAEPVVPLEIGGTHRAGSMLYPLMDQLRFRWAARKEHPALIHINPSLNFSCLVREGLIAWQTKQMGLPLLVFWRGWDKPFEAKVETKYRSFFRRTFGRADAFIVLASEFERTLRDWGITVPIFRETTSVDDRLLANFSVLDKWPDPPQQLKTIKILFLARLEQDKGAFETIQAFRQLLSKNSPVSLTIAGDGSIRHELEEYARIQKLTREQVRFTGDIRGESKTSALTEHHIYCFPTFYGEGLPNSVLEAMAFGMPVVTRPVGGLADIFEDKKMGRLVTSKSPEEITGCLEELVTNQDTMAKIGRYNAEYAGKHFRASKVAGRLLRIYDEVLAGISGKKG
jgi:glycosyltransferase involved in cell wall biosynthesis